MIRRPPGCRWFAALGRGLLLTVMVLFGAGAVPGAPPAPYRLLVDVSADGGVAEQRFRDSLELELLGELELSRCFRETASQDSSAALEADLLLRVKLVTLQDEMIYDLSIADRSSQRVPGDGARGFSALLEAELLLELRKLPEQTVLREKRMRLRSQHRPLADEDPRAVVELQAVDEAARSSRRWVCRGRASRLRKQLGR